MKTIGILTSGGDAPGMNAAVRAVTRSALAKGLKVKAILNGYAGLMSDQVEDMSLQSVDNIISLGGTVLGTARSPEMESDEGQEKAVEVIKKHGIEGLVVIGGDGSFQGAYALHKRGIKTIGIPATIDNDMGFTELTIGFPTATETAVDSIRKLRDTSGSHGRVNVVEVMGRHCGDIALYAGIAGGAESIIVPEVDFSIDAICNKIIKTRARGKKHHIIVVAEGINDIPKLVDGIKEKTQNDTKHTVLGHIQRGGSPLYKDVVMASEMGLKAVDLLLEGQSSQAIGYKGGKIFNMPITEAVKTKEEFNKKLYELSDVLSY